MDVRAMADACTSILQRTYVHWLVHVRAFFLGRIKKDVSMMMKTSH